MLFARSIKRLKEAAGGCGGCGQFRTQRNIAITGGFASANVQDHALTVDVAHPKQRRFGPAHARTVEQHENGAVQEIRSRLDEACDSP
jgi:hypothetical protein